MIAVVQRVSQASVRVEGEIVGQIGPGLLVLAAICADDQSSDVQWMARKVAGLRIFRGADKHFELDVKEAGGSVLLVSNFTVAASTAKGRRPSFAAAAPADRGAALFEQFIKAVRGTGTPTETGRFGADMLVSLVNDGPVTVILDSAEAGGASDRRTIE